MGNEKIVSVNLPVLRKIVLKHWFKLSLFVLIIIFCFKKDWSFSFKLNDASKHPKEIKMNAASKPNNIKITELNTQSPNTSSLSMGSAWQKEAYQTLPTDISETDKKAYFKRFARVAVAEKQKFGIPASLVLAAAFRQSYAGQRSMAVQNNNHFALLCGGEEPHDDGCYQRFDNAWSSFRAFSEKITTGKYAPLRKLPETDYKAWARGLEKLNYPCTCEHFAADLIEIVETYGLQRLDEN
jgi:flagellum-specific peptidoglycan hydrolase FlgJ